MFATLIKRLWHDRRGGTAIEYGLILALVVITIFMAIVGVAQATIGMWNDVGTKVQTVTPGK